MNDTRPEPTKPRSLFDAFEWVDRAACGHPDAPTMFPHPSDAVGIDLAKECCDRCPVLAQCLAWAVDHGEPDGVWGGTTPDERSQMRRRESRARSRRINRIPIHPAV